MYNMLLDRLPTDYNGYLIRTSFRIGMQICMCLKDDNYTEEEKLGIAFDLLYGYGVPNTLEEAMDGLSWFLSCGQKQKKQSGSNKELFYWDFDSARIFSSFMSTYGIDLTKEDMHWFKFIAMIGSLRKDSAFNSAVEIRSYDMRDLKGKARAEMQKMKNDLTPEREYTEEEQRVIDEFNAQFGGDVNG